LCGLVFMERSGRKSTNSRMICYLALNTKCWLPGYLESREGCVLQICPTPFDNIFLWVHATRWGDCNEWSAWSRRERKTDFELGRPGSVDQVIAVHFPSEPFRSLCCLGVPAEVKFGPMIEVNWINIRWPSVNRRIFTTEGGRVSRLLTSDSLSKLHPQPRWGGLTQPTSTAGAEISERRIRDGPNRIWAVVRRTGEAVSEFYLCRSFHSSGCPTVTISRSKWGRLVFGGELHWSDLL
jgi:hypothetical protein